jgi:hypothetical protein
MAIAPDPLEALVSYLAADSDVASLAGSRVYGAELPGEDADDMPQYAVVVQDAGGFGSRSESPQYNARFDVFAYGPDTETAKQLQLACIGALRQIKRKVLNSTILYSAIKETGPFPGRTPEGLWPFSFSVWSVETNYQEVT